MPRPDIINIIIIIDEYDDYINNIINIIIIIDEYDDISAVM